jgi:hypothetical protein
MKYIRTLILASICAASLAGAGNAAGMMQGGSSANRIQSWVGAWSCTSKTGNYTATFSSMFSGKGMRLTDTGKMADEHLIVWDAKRGKWIDQSVDASGGYSVMEGTPNGDTIRFTQAYPAGSATTLVTRPSKNMFTVSYTAMMKGKMISGRDTCTRT